MRFSTKPGFTALLALFVNWLFFFEYFRPFLRVFIPYDLEGYHYPLMDFAFREVHAGRLPEWDSGIYCGLPLAGNIQAALLYPPTWLLFALNIWKSKLPYGALQIFVLLHIWLAFALSYAWLHARRLHPLACWIGAGVLAYSGYMMTQMQHLGLIVGVAWFPLAFWGIDEAAMHRSWQPLWKVAAASALVFLGGYTPLWTVFAVCIVAYAVGAMGGIRPLAGVLAALAFSMLLAAAQLLPSVEVSRFLTPQSRYGAGERVLAKFFTFALPNFYEFGLHMPRDTNLGFDYWYLGAAGLLGCAAALTKWPPRASLSAYTTAGATLIFLTNPLNAVGAIVERWPLVASVVRSWYFMPGLTVSAALLAALGFDRLLGSNRPKRPAWIACCTVIATVAWSARLLYIWRPWDAIDFPHGFGSALEPVVGVTLLALLAFAYRGSAGTIRNTLAVVIAIFSLLELKALGTSRRFNGSHEMPPPSTVNVVPGFDEAVFARMWLDREFRTAVSDQGGPPPVTLRHFGLATPQGFDPLLTTAFHELAEKSGAKFASDRLFALDPANLNGLRSLGVKYFAAPEASVEYPKLKSPGSGYKFTGAQFSYYKVYELIDPSPAYAWTGASAKVIEWLPAKRVFELNGDQAGTFRLAEQFFPGWTATVDGRATVISRCHDAFQCIDVPPGSHKVEFVFRSMSLRWGALVSALAIAALIWFARATRAG